MHLTSKKEEEEGKNWVKIAHRKNLLRLM